MSLDERIERHAHPRDLTEEQLDEIATEEALAIEESRLVSLPLNGRLVLAMIREIKKNRRA